MPDEAAARRVLGVTARAGQEEIRHAYRARAREHHPDRHSAAPADVRARHAAAFAEANAAWLLLRRGPATRAASRGDGVDDIGDFDDFDDAGLAADLADDAALTGAQPGCLAVGVPIVLFVAAVIVFGAAVLFEARVLWQASLAFGAGAAIMFALAPFFTMLRSRR